MQDYVDFYPYVILPKEAKLPQKQISHWMLENVWKHKSYLDPQIKVTARLILL